MDYFVGQGILLIGVLMRAQFSIFFNAILVIAFASPALAVAADRTVTILGGSTCTGWIETKRVASLESPSDLGWVTVALKRSWLLGYMSALNLSFSSDKNILKSVNSSIVEAWIDKYCAQNSKMSIEDGATKLFIELVKINR